MATWKTHKTLQSNATWKTHKTLQSNGNLKDTQNTTVKWQLERHTKHYSEMATSKTHKTLQSNGNLKDTQNTRVKWQLERHTTVILQLCKNLETKFYSQWIINSFAVLCKLYTTFNGHLLYFLTLQRRQEFHPLSVKVETALQCMLRNNIDLLHVETLRNASAGNWIHHRGTWFPWLPVGIYVRVSMLNV